MDKEKFTDAERMQCMGRRLVQCRKASFCLCEGIINGGFSAELPKENFYREQFINGKWIKVKPTRVDMIEL